MQLPQLRRGDAARCLGHYAGGGLGFRERDNIADRGGAGHQHHQPVQAEGQATVRRGAVAQGVEEEAELLLRLLLIDAENVEHRGLGLAVTDTDTAAAQLRAVEHHVVGAGQGRAGIAAQRFGIAGGRREGWCSGAQPPSPSSSNIGKSTTHSGAQPAATMPRSVPTLQAQGAQGFVDHGGAVGAEEDDIAVGCLQALHHLLHHGFGHELEYRRLQPSTPAARSLTLIQARPRAP
jgi:hypothetical protein